MSRLVNIAIATYIKAQKANGDAKRRRLLKSKVDLRRFAPPLAKAQKRVAVLRTATLFWALIEISKRSCVIGHIRSSINNG
jgi:hypothetical protein